MDDPGIVNLAFTYVGATSQIATSSSLPIGDFTFRSIFGTVNPLGQFAGQDFNANTLERETSQGNVQLPAVPEPSSALTATAAMLLLARRRHRRA